MSRIRGNWIEDFTINESKIRLQNDQYLVGRDVAGLANINILKVNALDQIEFGAEPIWGTAPSIGSALANKDYVDSVVFGIRDPKDACRVASTGNIDLALMPAVVDGVTLAANDRFLAKDQTLGEENGIYVFAGAGVPAVRSEDADSDEEVTQGLSTLIVEGSVHSRTTFALTTPDPIVLGTTVLSFAQVPTLGTVLNFRNVSFVITATDITNGFIDLAHEAIPGSVNVAPKGGPKQESGVDYSLSIPIAVTQITFAGDLALYLTDADTLLVDYSFES